MILNENKKNKILRYLKKNTTLLNAIKKSIELTTIHAVIQHISSHPHNNNLPDNSEKRPCPNKKLTLRFAEFKECIEEEFVDLYAEHNDALVSAKENYIDDGNSNRIKNYLRKISRDKLYDEKNNARTALNTLIEELKKGLEFDVYEGALRFYILSELMDCDIFPLTKQEATSLGE